MSDEQARVTGFTIYRDSWMRNGSSVLHLHTEQIECCVGTYLRHCGVPTHALLAAGTADEVDGDLPPQARWLRREGSTGILYETREARLLYDANDDESDDEGSDASKARFEEGREDRVEEYFLNQGIAVVFADGKDPELAA